MQIQGIILGKFSPFHRGHAYLVEQALQQCDALTVFVISEPSDPIPGWQRYHWVKSSFPELDVRHMIGNQFSQSLALFKPAQLKLFEGGYAQKTLAQQFDIQHVDIDPVRMQFPIPTSAVRENPYTYQDLLMPAVRPYYIRRIALVGPESCGKSYLAEKLAQHFNTVFVEEYGRTYCEKFGMDSTELDFAHVAGGQLYREDEMALQANRVLFCDTDLIVTQVWSEVYFKGKCQPWIFWADHLRRYDLFLLCAPDIPWVNDGLREFEHQRDWMYQRLQEELVARGLPHVVIKGGFDERTNAAISVVNELLAHI